MKSYRKISKIVTSFDSEAAPGFKIKRAIPNYEFDYVDPFIMLDHFGPKMLKPGEATGVGEHPHRGFETVTFMFDGLIEHRDSNGNFGLLSSGGIQWMTAGSGVIHSELHPKEFKEQGGKIHGVQLWVNLPASLKMTKPKYQDLDSSKIPSVELENGNVIVRVVAGDYFGAKGPASTHTPIAMMHVQISGEKEIEFEIPETFNSFVYVTEGEGYFGENSDHIKGGQMGVFKREGTTVKIKGSVSEHPLNLLIISGEPINEPVVSYGPFVMNTQEQIWQAVYDYQSGKMGKIEAELV